MEAIIYYSLLVVMCLFVYLRTRKLYSLSGHEGIRSFRNAFLFFGIAFLTSLIGAVFHQFNIFYTLFALIFMYAMSMAGFSLVYSLVWKHIEKKKYFLLHALAVAIALAEIFLTDHVMFVSQLAVLAYGIYICYQNYSATKKRFLGLYLIGLILAFVSYLVNFMARFITPFYPVFIYYVYGITLTVFIIFVLGVQKIIKWPKKEKD